jgi:hypothetical protein
MGSIMVGHATRDASAFISWYVDSIEEIQHVLVKGEYDDKERESAAAQVVNTFLFSGFIHGDRKKDLDFVLKSGLKFGLLDPSIHALACHKNHLGQIKRIFDALSAFSLSLSENTTLEPFCTIHPVMLDAASEALARRKVGTEKIASRGTFYTNGPEIALMCQAVLNRYLLVSIPAGVPNSIDILFSNQDLDVRAKTARNIDGMMRKSIIKVVKFVSILDPACGSGAFLVGMASLCLDVLVTLESLDTPRLNNVPEMARHVLASLHGIDIDGSATHLARTRLLLWYMQKSMKYGANLDMESLPDLVHQIVTGDFFTQETMSGAQRFDIIIGNPPYVRQEDIKPFMSATTTPTRLEKDRYKESIMNAVLEGIPSPHHVSRMSDLYVYFFYKGLQLLKDGGSLSFITSNSWLDATFGTGLQSFLLENAHDIVIQDFSTRNFSQADINTVITTCSYDTTRNHDNDKILFVHFKETPGAVLERNLLSEIQTFYSNNPTINVSRISPRFYDSVSWRGLQLPSKDLVSGMSVPGGSKWRGRFLNPNDIYYTILDACSDKLVFLGELAAVKAGCYSGINDFFYLDPHQIEMFGIEPEYCQALIRSAMDVHSLQVPLKSSHDLLVVPPVPKAELKRRQHDGVVSYIEWGEAQKTFKGQKTAAGIPWPDVASVRPREFWYALPAGNTTPTCLFMQYIAHDRFYCPWSMAPVISDRCYHRVYPRNPLHEPLLRGVLNSTFLAFLVMTTGRAGLGGGALKMEVVDAKQLLVPDPRFLGEDASRRLDAAINRLGNRAPLPMYAECGMNMSLPLENQVPRPLADRAALDNIIFDMLGLNATQREDVYRATCQSIASRLKKARINKPGDLDENKNYRAKSADS